MKQEDTPILKRVERMQTLEQLAMELKSDEWHQMAMRTLSGTSSAFSETIPSSPTPTAIIRDSDLASSWIYSSRKAEASKEIEGNSNDNFVFEETAVRPFVPAQSSTKCCSCFKYTCIALIVLICFLGIFSSVGGIMYLEMFVSRKTQKGGITSELYPGESVPVSSTPNSLLEQVEHQEVLDPVEAGSKANDIPEDEEDNWVHLRDLMYLSKNSEVFAKGSIPPSNSLIRGDGILKFTRFGIPFEEDEVANFVSDDSINFNELSPYTAIPGLSPNEGHEPVNHEVPLTTIINPIKPQIGEDTLKRMHGLSVSSSGMPVREQIQEEFRVDMEKVPSLDGERESMNHEEHVTSTNAIRLGSGEDTLMRKHGLLPESVSSTSKPVQTLDTIELFKAASPSKSLIIPGNKVVSSSHEAVDSTSRDSIIPFGEFLKIFRRKLSTQSTPVVSPSSKSIEEAMILSREHTLTDKDTEEKINYLKKLRNLMVERNLNVF